jgi:hypothetical protein
LSTPGMRHQWWLPSSTLSRCHFFSAAVIFYSVGMLVRML